MGAHNSDFFMDIPDKSALSETLSRWYVEYGFKGPCVSVYRHYEGFLHWLFPSYPVYFVLVREKTNHITIRSVLKIHGSIEDALEEFTALDKVHGHFAKIKCDCNVPAPLGVIKDPAGVLMSLVPGKRLDRMIWPSATSMSSCVGQGDALNAIARAASWLAYYQKMAPHNDQAHFLQLSEMQRRLWAALDLCRKHDLGALPTDLIRDWISKNEEAVSDASCACVPVCQFQPCNVLISRETTTVVDFEAASCGWPAEDLASFLLYCELRQRSWLPTRHPLEALMGNFVRQYASRASFGPQDRLSLEISYLLKLLERLLFPWQTARSAHLATLAYFRLRSWLARQLIVERAAKGRWQPLLR